MTRDLASTPLFGLSLALALVCLPACTDDAASEGGETGDSASGDGDPTSNGSNSASNTGDGDGDSGDGDGDGDSGDGDGDGDGNTGDGDGEPDPDPDPPPGCGDGQINPGEACDDGNTIPGDGCSALCQLPGELLWELMIDLEPGVDDLGLELVVDKGSRMGVLVDSGASGQSLIQLSSKGTLLWQNPSIVYDRPNLALGPDDELAIAGRLGSQGAARVWDSQGDSILTALFSVSGSGGLDVGIDGQGYVVTAGYRSDSGALARFDPVDVDGWEQLQDSPGSLGPIAVDTGGGIWVMRSAFQRLERYSSAGSAGWVAEDVPGQTFEDIELDAQGRAYVLANRGDFSGFELSCYDSEGGLVWTYSHDESNLDESGFDLFVSAGGLVVVGTRGDGTNALTTWVSFDGALLADVTINEGEDDDRLLGVAATGSVYAVAVGGNDGALWVRKFEY